MVTNSNETRSAPLAHPVTLGRRAAALWTLGRIARYIADVAGIAALWWTAAALNGSTATWNLAAAALAVLVAMEYAQNRLGWHAFTYVPGAFRVYSAGDPSQWHAPPSLRQDSPNLIAAAVDAALLAVGGVLVVGLSAPGADVWAAQLIGGAGGAGAALLLWRVVAEAVDAISFRTLRHTDALLYALRAMPLLVWIAIGSRSWALLFFVIVVAGKALQSIFRFNRP